MRCIVSGKPFFIYCGDWVAQKGVFSGKRTYRPFFSHDAYLPAISMVNANSGDQLEVVIQAIREDYL